MHRRENFTAYEVMPEDLAIYLSHNGPHFNKAACMFALDNMFIKEEGGEEKKLVPINKKEVDAMLTTHGVTIRNNRLYDAVYVANMCKADYYGSSIQSEESMAKYIKDTLDDVDGMDGLTFNRWIADMKWLGIPIPWYDFL